jgi:UDP-glucose 4-epimerase
MTVLITGGAGYIGSHVAAELLRRGHTVVVLDDLSTGRKENVPPGAKLVTANVGNAEALNEVFGSDHIESVLHFAGSIKVEESKRLPLKYYLNNTANTIVLLNAMLKFGVRTFVFSSTAAVYGEPKTCPVAEDAPLAPINPYGHSKLLVERVLEEVSAAQQLSYVALRYFNVVGVAKELTQGYAIEQNPAPLFRAVLKRVFEGGAVPIFGTDYPTPDGSCIRDYVHISDLVDAHVRALEYLRRGGNSTALNVGYGYGYSVFEVVKEFERVCGSKLAFDVAPRRPGDAAAVSADSTKIRHVLGWAAQHNNLTDMVESQYRWEQHVRSR